MSGARVILTTVGTVDDAKRIARLLVEERLAACVSLTAVESLYAWEGRVAEDPETLLVIKTSAARVDALERRLRELHPYSVPEFVVLAAEHVAAPYMEWLTTAVAEE
jgi:periplasmic divalent cation tolerance protein